MATEVKEIDQIIAAMRELKRDSEWPAGIKRIGELAERVVVLEDENSVLRKQYSEEVWDKSASLAEMTKQRDRLGNRVSELKAEVASQDDQLGCQNNRFCQCTSALDDTSLPWERIPAEITKLVATKKDLLRLNSELTTSRDYHRSQSESLMEEVATLKQTIEDQEQKQILPLRGNRIVGLPFTLCETHEASIVKGEGVCELCRLEGLNRRVRIALVGNMPMTDRITKALGVLSE